MNILNLSLCILGVAFATYFSVWSFEKVPTSWIFDYGQMERTSEGNLRLFSREKKMKAIAFTMIYFIIVFSVFQDEIAMIVSQLSEMNSYKEGETTLNFIRSTAFVFKIAILFLLSHIGISDILNQIIPDQHIIMVGALGFLLRGLSYDGDMLDNLVEGVLGAIIGFLLYFIPFVFAYIISKKEIVGFGDIKFFAALGIAIGAEKIVVLFVFTNIFSFLVSIVILACEYLNSVKALGKLRKCCKIQGCTTLSLAPIINLLFIFCIYY